MQELKINSMVVFSEHDRLRLRVHNPFVTLIYDTSTGHVVGRAERGVVHDSNVALLDVLRDSIPSSAWNIAHTIYVDTSTTPAEVKLCMAPSWSPSVSTITANGTSASVLTGIPAGAEIRISDAGGSAILIADGTALSITALVAGSIEIVVFHPHYQVVVYTVEAV
jgi:hypothetical protein